jgi:hypothetical protein
VYKVKTRSNGSLERYKDCLIARSFQQEHGHDYDETFTPVPHMTTAHTIFVVASIREWSAISQLDVKIIFPNGELCEEVYMRSPPWYSVLEGMICYLSRSLYGLKQALRAWFINTFPLWSRLLIFQLVLMIWLSFFMCHLTVGLFSFICMI